MSAEARAPDAFDRLGEELADRVNPIIVKEVRQGLRTRVFWIFFGLMLLANLFISLIFFAMSDSTASQHGRAAFISFFVALGLVQFFVIPYASYRSMAREAEDETWVLLTLTGIGPRRILAGKLGSAVLQGLLYASAAAPFLLFSYFLNGIDLPTIIVGVVLAAGYQVFLVSVSVSLATLAETKIARALLHFVLLGLLLQGLGFGIAGAAGAGEIARSMSASSASFWLGAGGVLFGFVSTGLLLFESAAARLSLPTEDYARGLRLAYVAQFTGALLIVVLAWLQSDRAEWLTVGLVLMCIYAALAGGFVASDRDGMARVHWETGRRFALLRPGGLRGYLLVVGLLLLGSVVLLGAAATTSLGEKQSALMVAAPAYALMMLSLPVGLVRFIPHPAWQTPVLTRLVFLGLLVLLAGVPPLVGELFSEADDLLLNALNPVVGLVNIEREGWQASWLMVLVWAVAAGSMAWALFSLRRADVEWRA